MGYRLVFGSGFGLVCFRFGSRLVSFRLIFKLVSIRLVSFRLCVPFVVRFVPFRFFIRFCFLPFLVRFVVVVVSFLFRFVSLFACYVFPLPVPAIFWFCRTFLRRNCEAYRWTATAMPSSLRCGSMEVLRLFATSTGEGIDCLYKRLRPHRFPRYGGHVFYAVVVLLLEELLVMLVAVV